MVDKREEEIWAGVEEDKGDRQKATKKERDGGGWGSGGVGGWREERESISGRTAADLSWRDIRRTSGP